MDHYYSDLNKTFCALMIRATSILALTALSDDTDVNVSQLHQSSSTWGEAVLLCTSRAQHNACHQGPHLSCRQKLLALLATL